MRTAALTAFALVAFAANSILCRLALGGGQIDAASFSAIRILSAALVVWVFVILSGRRAGGLHGNWISGVMLALYAISFSYAYLSLTAGTGALILFAAVQATMMGTGIARGERLRALGWTGFVVALAGFIWLLAPGWQAPSPRAAALMAIAGIGWGIYSLRGHRTVDPVSETAGNFVRAAPFAVIVAVFAMGSLHASSSGVMLALLSGAFASGIGYIVWYLALRGLGAAQAGIVQLIVPVLTAIGGIVLLAENVTVRLAFASVMILGGVLLALLERTVLDNSKGTAGPAPTNPIPTK